MKRALVLAGVFSVLIGATLAVANFALPTLPPPHQYGNILMNRTSKDNNMPPVIFQHWRHRIEYTCRVCHLELEFDMKAGTSDVSCQKKKEPTHCRACHDGKHGFDMDAFDGCKRCHNGNISYGKEKFAKLERLPHTEFGDEINWVKAINKGKIKPKRFLNDENYKPMEKNDTLNLEAEWPMVPPAKFPHKVHVKWLDCENCHDSIFNIKKKSTPHFEMGFILEGKFCGVCHLSVAFPIHDCKRCHPGLKQ